MSNIATLISSGVPVAGLQQVAQAVAMVFTIAEKVYANKEDFQIIAQDAADLIVSIWGLQQKSADPKTWLSPELRQIVVGLAKTLNQVNDIVVRQNKRNKITRVIFYTADSKKIRQLREKITAAVEKFNVLSSIKMSDLLLEVKTMQQNLSNQIDDRNGSDNLRQEEKRVEKKKVVEEEEEEPVRPVTKRRPVRSMTAPTPGSSKISGFSFSNNGSGQMFNQNVGNIVNTTYSNVGNNNARNYEYDSSPRSSRSRARS